MRVVPILLICVLLAACTPPAAPQNPENCPQDARVCPDGTVVGRVGTHCVFESCPEGPSASVDESERIECTPDITAEPCSDLQELVCGWYNENVQCVQAPCAKTYSNKCWACKDEVVSSFTPGECPR